MKTNAINNTGTNNVTIHATRNASEEEKTLLASKIKQVENVLLTMTAKLKNEATTVRDCYFMLGSLQCISNKKGKEAVVRLKNDRFKPGQSNNIVKNWLHGSRYQLERKAAVECFGLKGKDISAGEGMAILEQNMESKNNRVSLLQRQIRQTKSEYHHLHEMKSDVEQKLRAVITAEKQARDSQEAVNDIRHDFSTLYQSDAGCKAINAQARFQYGHAQAGGHLRSDEVIAEYKRVHGDEVFSKGNKDILYTIQARCSQLAQLVSEAAKAWYTPGGKNSTTHRGQGMTPDGIRTLIRQFNSDRVNHSDTIYQTGQFFSASGDIRVAHRFASESQDAVRVIFDIKGNSGRTLAVSGGLSFMNREREILYSPLARFKVTAITREHSGIYHIKLEETGEKNNVRLLPY